VQPVDGTLFSPNNQVTVSWQGGPPDSILAISLRDFFGDSPATSNIYNDEFLAYADISLFSTKITIPSATPSGDYFLTIDVLSSDFESTGVTTYVEIFVSASTSSATFIISATATGSVPLTINGAYGTTVLTIDPTSTGNFMAAQTITNIGEMYSITTTASTANAIVIHTDASTAAIFALAQNVVTPNCGSQADCFSCNNQSSGYCGWCEFSQLCLPTGTNGPLLSPCNLTFWITTTDGCLASGTCTGVTSSVSAGSTTGAAGSTTGAAGSTTGAAGSTTGAAGSTTGAAGSTTSGTTSGNNGCTCPASTNVIKVGILLLVLVILLML